ncbi:hypothetical protein Sjap_007209 [Stephania japonica]|uniref:Uncharacterized protein n=1 Tax=Stephania japonica TaxID=461633 RepID=A0AAP0PDH4_9MAGN
MVKSNFSKRQPEIKAFNVIFSIVGLISQYSLSCSKSLMMSSTRRSNSIGNTIEALIICAYREILPFKLWYPNGRSRISMQPQLLIIENLDIGLLLMTVRCDHDSLQ